MPQSIACKAQLDCWISALRRAWGARGAPNGALWPPTPPHARPPRGCVSAPACLCVEHSLLLWPTFAIRHPTRWWVDIIAGVARGLGLIQHLLELRFGRLGLEGGVAGGGDCGAGGGSV